MLRRAFEHRRHGAARTASGRLHVDQHGNIVVRDMSGETAFVDFDGMAGEKRLVTGTAARAVGRALNGKTIGAPAMSADDLACVAHVPVLTCLILAIFSLSSRNRS